MDVKDGRLCHEQYRPPFDDIFNVPQFEYGTRVEVAPPNPNHCPSFSGLPVWLGGRKPRYRRAVVRCWKP